MALPTASVLETQALLSKDPYHSAGIDHIELWCSEDCKESSVTIYPDLNADYKYIINFYRSKVRKPSSGEIDVDLNEKTYVLTVKSSRNLFDLTSYMLLPCRAYSRAVANHLKPFLHNPSNWTFKREHCYSVFAESICPNFDYNTEFLEEKIRSDFYAVYPDKSIYVKFGRKTITEIEIIDFPPCKCVIS